MNNPTPARSSLSSCSWWLALVAVAAAAAGCGAGGPLSRQAAALNSRGAAQLASGDVDAAEASLRVALEYNDRYAEPHNNLGLVALARGRVREAREHFRAAIARNRDFAEAWSNLGAALSRSEGPGDREATSAAAIDALREALAIDPGLVEARTNLVRALLASGQVRAALGEARRLTQLAPDDAIGHALRAEAALRLGLAAEAGAEARLAHARAPADPDVALVAARVDLAAGAVDRALAHLAPLADHARLGGEARALRAAAYAATGDADGARRELAALGAAAATHPVARVVAAQIGR